MKILAVDTTLGACSAAVLDGEHALAHRLEVMERGHAEALAPMVETVMRDAKLRFGELARLAVTTGPGTFTGQRVGLAFMRGLRVALGVPLNGVTTLEAMAAAVRDQTEADYAVVLHDARRDEVYAGMFEENAAIIEPCLLTFEDAIAALTQRLMPLAKKIAFAGTASARAAERFKAPGSMVDLTSTVAPDAVWVARLAVRRPPMSEAPRPIYLRPPDARPPGVA